MNEIKLGYELDTAKQINIKPSHLIVTGLSQKSGKTTTLEALISRSKKRAIVFRTKVGEKSFIQGTVIPPYFKERSDWEFIQSLIESTMKIKINWRESAKIKQICKKTNSLLEFKQLIDQKLANSKISNFDLDLYTNLESYLAKVLPKLQSINFSEKLELTQGLNIVDLERFARDSEVQSLIIMSIMEEILYNHKDNIIVIPEAWKFIPQDRGNPCKLIVEEFIRQGAANNNFLWIDSQDISGVDKSPLKQITEWILGYQAEKNEVKHTIDQIPLPKDKKPKPDEIMTLGKGIFIYASRDLTTKVYIQPEWLDNARSEKIAKGLISVDEIDAPKPVKPTRKSMQEIPHKISFSDNTDIKKIFDEMNELREDMFNKILDVQNQIDDLNTTIYNLKTSKPEINEDTIVAKVLQKIPTPKNGNSIDIDQLKKDIISQIPTTGKTYEIEPIEALKNKFQEEAKQKILEDISTLDDNAKKVLKYLEAKQKGVKSRELEEKCFMMTHSQSAVNKVSQATKQLRAIGVSRKDTATFHYGILADRIRQLLEAQGGTKEDVTNVYNHIIMELL